MAVVEAGSAARQRVIAELEAGLGPFDDPDWREDLALLSHTVRFGALLLARDCEAIVALARRVPRSPSDERGGTPWTSFVREVAVAKKISDQAAHAEVALSHQLLASHPLLLASLHAGAAPPQRARLLVQECARYADPVAAVADRLLTDRLSSLPPWRIRQEVTLLALRLDPEAAARREATATADRGASLTALQDAQAEVVLTGPAPLVQRWWDALTDRARALKAAGDPRSLTTLRFDLAVQTDPRELTGHDDLAAACGIEHPAADPSGQDGPDEPPAASPATGGADGEGGRGGRRNGDDRRFSDERRFSDDPGPGRDEAPPQPAAQGEAPARPAAQDEAPPARRGLGADLPTDTRCTRPVQATVMVPAATALGLSEEPGWLDGYGWISAPLSRSLLTVAELRKACLAPHTGQLIDQSDRILRPPPTPAGLRQSLTDMVLTPHELRPTATDSQPQHDPSPALEALVHARDRWCDGPTGTRVAAPRTDKDHEQSWPAGPTRASNLASRAPRTHQLKHTGWTPTRDATGTTWRSPAGQTAHTPRHDHPPPPVRPGAGPPPDPEQLAARDCALVRAGERADSDATTGEATAGEATAGEATAGEATAGEATPGVATEPDQVGPAPDHTPPAPSRAGPTPSPPPGRAPDDETVNGWPAEPPF